VGHGLFLKQTGESTPTTVIGTDKKCRACPRREWRYEIGIGGRACREGGLKDSRKCNVEWDRFQEKQQYDGYRRRQWDLDAASRTKERIHQEEKRLAPGEAAGRRVREEGAEAIRVEKKEEIRE
jgi:hypothetical protein